jgi:hypothetical protein
MTMPQPMPTTRLGRSGLLVSRQVLGTMTFGLQTDEATSHAILDKPRWPAASTSSTPPTSTRWAARWTPPAAPRRSSAAG